MKSQIKKAVIALSLTAALLPATVSADDSDSWEFGASVYGWLPDISGSTTFPDGSGGDFTLPIDTILDNLKFTFQGAFDARKGNWGLVTDVIYMDLGNSKGNIREGSIGDFEIPVGATAKVSLDMTSWIWTTAGYYRMLDTPQHKVDILAGVRYLDIEQTLKLSLTGDIADQPLPGRDGKVVVGGTNWDAIIGVRGKVAFGKNNAWFLPYKFDVGTGDSDLTWQALGGIGYTFGWGEILGVYRYMDYELDGKGAMNDMNFGGPAFGAVWHW